MLVSINATTITSEEVRITATNLETILLADDLYSQINDKEEEEEVTFCFDATNLGHRNTFSSCANLRSAQGIKRALAK